MSQVRQKNAVQKMKSTRGRLGRYRLEMRRAKRGSLGRIILCEKCEIYPERAKALLLGIADALLAERGAQARLHVLTACGGFVEFEWPEDSIEGRADFDALVARAEFACKVMLTPAVRRSLRRVTKFLSLGMDAWWGEDHWEPHAELVVLVDLDSNRYFWSGKCYPTQEQRRHLVSAPVASHAIKVNGERILLLGCHDLTAFNPRAMATSKGAHRKLGKAMRDLARQHKPTLVLQHPHVTDTARSWRSPWLWLAEDLPSVKQWLGAGRYVGRGNRKPRGEIDKVLRDTASEATVDVLVVPIDGRQRLI